MATRSLPAPLDVPAPDALRAGHMVVGIAIGLTALGLVMVYSTSGAMHAAAGQRQADGLLRQLRWVVIGAVAGFIVSRLSLQTLRRISTPVLGFALVLLVATLVFSPAVKGSRRWLYIAGFSIQASEVLKIGALLYLADRLATRERDQARGAPSHLLSMLAPVGIGVVLVLVEPDLGASLFLVAEAVVLLGLAGIRPTRVVPFALTVIPVIVLFAYTRFPHVRDRLAIYASGAGSGTQLHEALIGIGSGGLVGKGLGEGAQKLGYFSEAHNDFIFAVIGEELGFLGCAAVVVAFMAFVWYGRKVAWSARSLGPHAFYLAAGATFIVSFQALINIAVVTATAPTKGVSLPFISTGGSNLLMACVCVGLILNVSRRAAAEGNEEAL